MGPRLFSRGNVDRDAADYRHIHLQWGRDSSVAEMLFVKGENALEEVLQWGRDSSVAEMV